MRRHKNWTVKETQIEKTLSSLRVHTSHLLCDLSLKAGPARVYSVPITFSIEGSLFLPSTTVLEDEDRNDPFSNFFVMPQRHWLALTCTPFTKSLGKIDFLTLQTYLGLRPPPKSNQFFLGQRPKQQIS